jgi:hypothetical protein
VTAVRSRAAQLLRSEWLLVAIIGAGVVVRLVLATSLARPPLGLHDPGFYQLLARQLVNGEGYTYLDGNPSAYYPPGYPFALTPLAMLIERGPLPASSWTGGIVVLNVVCQAIAMVATADVARRVTGRRAAGPVAAAVLAAWPNLILLSLVPLTESLFLALVTVALAVAVRAPWDTGWERGRMIAVGALLGAATLVRPITLPVLPLLLVPLLVSRIGWRRALTTVAGVGVAMVVVMLPWVARNAIAMNTVTLSTNTGDNAAMARYVGSAGDFNYWANPCFDGRFDGLDRPEYETRTDAHGRSCGLEFVREHPSEEARLWFRRIGATFRNDSDGLAAIESYGDDLFLDRRIREDTRNVANAYAAIVLVAAVPGAWFLLRRGAPGVLVVVAGAGMLLPVVLFFGDPRFKVPVLPVAAVAVAALLYGRRRSASA